MEIGNMIFKKMTPVFLFIFITACTARDESVDVTILPKQYKVGDFISELATPAVNEVVRRNPRKVHIYTCTTTLPEKVSQFNVEFTARSQAKITMTFDASGC